ncbi:Uma2 family endonuclease [uncultured Imperialibacter sp.]|uniref:Uma2 family endonuclease n=1 Tax=uncultured Imperialibacter sp. TaxID=1672639 RepID=UPI0030DC43D1|tara:strand:+ start:12181 stop:12801 length:621 start_codon:yes stop_codon:yes gene_type:complete
MAKPYQTPETDINDIMLLEPEATYSYAHYLRWSFEERVELIKGKVFHMSPAPNRAHQDISGNLHGILWSFLRKKKCKAYAAPFDVRLPQKPSDPDNRIFSVVQPDICVVCDPSKLDDKGCSGAPDIMVEILSPSTSSKDLKDKFSLYEENGVKEYWVVYPGEKVVEVFVLRSDGKYSQSLKFTDDESVTSTAVPELTINVNDIFDY